MRRKYFSRKRTHVNPSRAFFKLVDLLKTSITVTLWTNFGNIRGVTRKCIILQHVMLPKLEYFERKLLHEFWRER